MITSSISSNSELALSDWLLNYQEKIVEQGSLCSLGVAEINATLADIDYYIFLLKELHINNAYKQLMIVGYSKGKVVHPSSPEFPNMPPVPAPGIKNRLLDQIVRIKASDQYTEAMGYELGIISTAGIALINSVNHFVGVGNQVRKDITSYDYGGAWIDSHLNGADWAFFGE